MYRPPITNIDQQTILELLCSLLSPIGQHRRDHVVRSKGKRSKRQGRPKNKAINTTTSSTPPKPELIHHVTVGFNSTIQRLQLLASHSTSPITSTAAGEENSVLVKKMAAVFVSSATLPALLVSSMPALVAAASTSRSSEQPIRLVFLPSAAEKRLAEALFQPRVGFVGLPEDAPGAKALIDLIRQKITPVDASWLRTKVQGEYLPVNIKTTSSVPDKVDKKLSEKNG